MRCNIIIMMYRPRSISSPLCYCYHITENILPFTTLRYLLPWTWNVMQCSLLMISDQFRRPSGWQEESCLFPTPRCWWMDVVIVQWYLDSSHTETTNATCCIPHTHRLPMIDNKCYREWRCFLWSVPALVVFLIPTRTSEQRTRNLSSLRAQWKPMLFNLSSFCLVILPFFLSFRWVVTHLPRATKQERERQCVCVCVWRIDDDDIEWASESVCILTTW